MISYNSLPNKVSLIGTIITNLNILDMKGERILYFTLAVSRGELPQVFNKNENNYFYCYASEKLMGGAFLTSIQHQYKQGDEVLIKGILDSVPQDSMKQYNNFSKTIQNGFASLVWMTSVSGKPKENLERQQQVEKLTAKVKKDFGNDINVEIKKDAFEKDVYGLDNTDIILPDW